MHYPAKLEENCKACVTKSPRGHCVTANWPSQAWPSAALGTPGTLPPANARSEVPDIFDYPVGFPLEAVSMEIYLILAMPPSCWTLEACNHPRALEHDIPYAQRTTKFQTVINCHLISHPFLGQLVLDCFLTPPHSSPEHL